MNKRQFIKFTTLLASGGMFFPLSSRSEENLVQETKTACQPSNLIMVNPENTILRWKDLCVGQDWTKAFDAAAQWGKSIGGATIFIPKGIYNAQITLVENVYWVGEGRGVTIITQQPNENRDIVKSDLFDSLTGIGPLKNAPKNFGLLNLTIDGNYLTDYHQSFSEPGTGYNNRKGYGIKIFGSKFSLDLELVNCPEIGLYIEGVDYKGYTDEQDSKIYISGRVFGKEGIIHRGPADIIFTHVYLGCVGWKATIKERNSAIVMSDVYPGEPVHAMVADEKKIGSLSYNGHHEFGILHLYGNYNGYGYKSMSSGRIKGEQLICENCRGGVYFSEKSWGIISIIDCHNNGRIGSDVKSTSDYFPDLDILSKQGMTINAIVRRTKTESESYLALRSSGSSSKVTLNYFSTQPIPSNALVADISSSNSTYDLSIKNVNNDAIMLSGISNTININATNIKNGSLITLQPDYKGNIRPNDVRVTVTNCDIIVKMDEFPKVFNLSITGEIHENQTVSIINHPRKNDSTFTPSINIRKGVEIVNEI